MRLEFRQGVPPGCIDWLWQNVGPGNREPEMIRNYSKESDAWFYERVLVVRDSLEWYIPTITIKDSKKFILFALRWS